MLRNIKIGFNLHVPKILKIGLNNAKIWKKTWRVLIRVAAQQLLLKFAYNDNFRLEGSLSP